MAETLDDTKSKRIAIVTGGNKGIGFEICRQLASKGIMVILTARDAKKGNEALVKLKAEGLVDVVFHPLDVADPATVATLAEYMKTQFGKLDILVNNAGITGAIINPEDRKNLNLGDLDITGPKAKSIKKFVKQTYETAENCLKTNYYGIKQVSQALIPVLEQSKSARIINVSSTLGQLKLSPNERARKVLGDADGLTEEKVEKAALNACTRVLANKYPRIAINAVNTGFTKTDLNGNTGVLPVEKGAKGPVMLALAPDAGPSCVYFDRTEISTS
ncbi:hypothetical protein GH714_002730 [Hevea brasiliensis]|uniref:Uncharacterized protein n=1 Tax=Hevea brasiliensis TaxID=3981 RepID=A0A6A6LB49_HEVBR|nr:hypothetical protein GH714_002730 [Hevea brasiliensis]